MPEAAATSGTKSLPCCTYPQDTMTGSVQNPPKDLCEVGRTGARGYGASGRALWQGGGGEWYFEVWNEPDIDYWHGTPEEYWKLYDYAVAGVRKALPNAIVGGPATTGPVVEGCSISQELPGALENGKSAANGQPIPMDFISFHAKGIRL